LKRIFALILLCCSNSYVTAGHFPDGFVIGRTEGHGTIIETDHVFQLNTCDVPGYRVLDKKNYKGQLIYLCGGGIIGDTVYYYLNEPGI